MEYKTTAPAETFQLNWVPEEVSLEGGEHLEGLPHDEDDAEDGQDGGEAKDRRLGGVVELVQVALVRIVHDVDDSAIVVAVVALGVDLQLGSAEPQEDEGGEKDDEGDVEDEVGEPEGPEGAIQWTQQMAKILMYRALS